MSLSDWVEGRAKDGSKKEAQDDKGLIKSLQFGVRALNGHVRAISALSLRLLTLHFRNILDLCLGM